jgi:hypothetical protein
MPLISTNKTWSGTFTGTNTFTIKSYDPTGAGYEYWEFNWDNGSTSSNTVSRVGRAETFAEKTLTYTKFGDSSSYFTGIVKANGSSYADVVTPVSGSMSFNIGLTTITFQDGIFAGSSGSTNVTGTGVIAINALEVPAINIVTNLTGTDFNITSTSSNITVNLPTSSATSRGLLSAADWSDFDSKQPGSTNLLALAAYNANGLVVQVSEGTFAGRVIVSGDGTIEVTNGDGVSGDIDIRVSDNGYFYIRTIAGTPATVPPAETGKVPAVYDTTGNKLWIYTGAAWRSASFAP